MSPYAIAIKVSLCGGCAIKVASIHRLYRDKINNRKMIVLIFDVLCEHCRAKDDIALTIETS